MRVKRLEIQGFKSFKDKTVIHFDHGITGIVGPNGCGKSNIVDAFFWVMGEQSYKHMRGASSDDLIFNGSSKYSPLGLAEATLVLETDAVDTANAPAGASVFDIPVHIRSKEISVTRRLYRSGEGEYFINGTPARLKDIHELFMDTGVGAKGYSVIEQGQIGKIVNSKPEERRLLVEEAAGIAKYKARKKESLRKMEATQANLSRLNDVIQEIERSLNSLERQAQKARLYRKYKDELLDKEMTWGRRKNQVLRQKLEALRKDHDALEQELVGLRAELQISENAIETDRVDQITESKLAEELQSRIARFSDELSHERSALDLSRRRQGDLASQLTSLDHEQAELAFAIAVESERLQARLGEAAEAEQTFQTVARAAQASDESTRAARSEAETKRRDLENVKRELMRGITQASDLTSRAASLLSRMDSAVSQAERIEQQALAQAEKVTAARAEAGKASVAAGEARARRDGFQTERQAQSAQVQSQEQKLRGLEREAQDASKSLTQLRSRLQSLEELAASYEGIGDGPKAALDWAREKGRALTALADTLEVSAGYEAALEGWLEKRLETLITTDTSAALEAIEFLRAEKQGRIGISIGAACAVTIDFDSAGKKLEDEGFRVVGQLSDFVRAKSEVASSFISNVFVVEAISADQNLASLGLNLVSLSGTSLDASGVLKGGSEESNGAAGLLRRKQLISELQKQVAESEAGSQQKDSAAQIAKQEHELAHARLQALQTELQSAEIQSAGLERDVHQTTRSLKEAEEQFELQQMESREMRELAERSRQDRGRMEFEVQSITSARADLEARIASGETEVMQLEATLREKESTLQTLRVDEASLRERAVSLRRELEASQSLIRDRERRLAEVRRTLMRVSQEQGQFTGGESSLGQKIEELTKTLAVAREELSLVKDRLEQSSAKVNSALDRIKLLHKSGDEKMAQSTQLALELEKFSGDLNHLVQNLEEKYGPGCLERPVTSPIQEEMTEPVITAEMTAEEEQLLGEEVERLRERIRRLGEVNTGAIDEFEEVQKRNEYLTTEKRDLEQSIENLQEAIDHINKTSEERFKKAFEAIAERFERLFPIIFGGGSAKLSLVYAEGSTDILEAGVDILAQPPGKKVSNIALLSGGEKALTAVSLIFAIFMVKPSPFCVLDEVDAPLDDANIGKFNGLLREMSSKSQFILITHNKKTMELNDTLYGVTMEEPGVSKMVSVQLS